MCLSKGFVASNSVCVCVCVFACKEIYFKTLVRSIRTPGKSQIHGVVWRRLEIQVRASVVGLSTKYVWLVNKILIQAKFLYHGLETEFLLIQEA